MLRSFARGRYLLLALVSALVFVPLVSAHDSRQRHARSVVQRIDISNPFSLPGQSTPSASSSTASSTHSSTTSSSSSSSTTSSSSSDTSSKTTDASTATTSAASDTSPSASSNTASSTSASGASTTAASSTGTTTSNSALTSAPSSSDPAKSSVLSTAVSTNPAGEVVTSIIYATPSPSSTGSGGGGGSSSGISTGGIIGLSVAGGVLLLSVVAFAIFKFSRKRYLDEYDDGDAIKWPELNTHGDSPHALPTHRTGGAGFETSSEVNLTRPDSRAGSVAPSAAASALDLYPAQHDPYAVPPLPHLNPNVGGAPPYRDDPSAAYYDPYSGPVPHTLDGEAIPMTQIGGRARSPMPGGPGMGMEGGRMSPAPGAGYAPQMGGMRTMSPAPGAAYGASGYGA